MKATTKIFGCIADPIEHVKAPTIFTEYFVKNRIDAVMIPLNVTSSNLKQVLDVLKIIPNFCGVTVTIPHKVDVIKYCNILEEDALQTGAVNWIKFKNGNIIGNNFDGKGFVQGLKSSKIQISNKNICIFGAGGAGKAIACSLIKENIKELTIVNRDNIKSARLIKKLNKYNRHVKINSQNYENHDLSSFDIVINATSIGLKKLDKIPFEINDTKETCIIADIIMEPEETKLIKEARLKKKQVHLGKNMLKHQIKLVEKYFEIYQGN